VVKRGNPRSSARRSSTATTRASRARIVNLGFEPVDSSPQKFAETIAAEFARWGGIIRAAGIRAD
jgi:tripartite-type tricarboxylate transporter receptor subunit TctC